MTRWVLGRSYSFRDQEVRYTVIGEGPPVVLVHGTPFSSYVWHRIAPFLAERRQVFMFDLLGYGQSEKREGQDVSLGVQNEVFAELLVHWRLEQPDVVAHDFGGTTALRTHLLDRRDFKRLILIDPVVLAPWGIGFDRHVRQYEAAFHDMPGDIHQAIVSAYIRGATARTLSADELDPYMQPWLGPEGQAAFYRQISQFDQRFTDELAPRYRDVRCPTLILWGEEDRWLPIEHGRRLSTLIPSAQFRPVSGSGHLMQEDAPQALIAAIESFLLLGSADLP
ncbi:MAG TPA: alpha/beta hydrolase [Candidatus Dormibacteraeota bacterium]